MRVLLKSSMTYLCLSTLSQLKQPCTVTVDMDVETMEDQKLDADSNGAPKEIRILDPTMSTKSKSNQGRSSNDMPNSSQAMPNVTPNANPKVPISGKRRVWGTMKSCGAQAVKNTISRLTSLTDQI